MTSTISSATRPCASRWTASAASALGASNRQNTSPFSLLNQYLRAFAPYLSWMSRSFWCTSATRRRSILLRPCDDPCKWARYQVSFPTLPLEYLYLRQQNYEIEAVSQKFSPFESLLLGPWGYTSDLIPWIWSFLLDEENLIKL